MALSFRPNDPAHLPNASAYDRTTVATEPSAIIEPRANAHSCYALNFPRNLFKNPLQLLSLLAIHHPHMRNPPCEMTMEIRNIPPILLRRPRPRTIRQDRFQRIKLAPSDIHLLIQHQSGRALRNGSPHHPRLPRVHLEPFLQRNRANLDVKSFHTPRELRISAEKQIVRVPCISRARRLRQSGQPTIQPKRTQIRQRW